MSIKAPLDAEPVNTAEQLLNRIGSLTRQLREGMRELGLDKQVEKAAQAIPDARDRLNYVVEMTERAAHRALNAVDAAQPLQEELARSAKGLTSRWDAWFANPIELDQARGLVEDTRSYLGAVPVTASAINSQLMEILMAQDFQDLTGQVIKKMMEVVNEMETQLLQVLIDNSPVERRPAEPAAAGLLNGPQVVAGSADAVSDQSQVDDLLASLGF
jgi:chemotaxis protein CheZ